MQMHLSQEFVEVFISVNSSQFAIQQWTVDTYSFQRILFSSMQSKMNIVRHLTGKYPSSCYYTTPKSYYSCKINCLNWACVNMQNEQNSQPIASLRFERLELESSVVVFSQSFPSLSLSYFACCKFSKPLKKKKNHVQLLQITSTVL